MYDYKTIIGLIFIIILLVVAPSLAGQKSVEFIWDQTISDDLTGWNLYHNTQEVSPDNSTWEKFTEISYDNSNSTSFTSTETLTSPDGESVEHFFYMTSKDDSGNESSPSNIASTVIDFKAPDTPTTFSCRVIVQPE